MGQESLYVVRFDLGLLLVLEVCNVKLIYRKSWPGNLLWSDLTLGHSFEVKQGKQNLK